MGEVKKPDAPGTENVQEPGLGTLGHFDEFCEFCLLSTSSRPVALGHWDS
jgi:hypothetical protein